MIRIEIYIEWGVITKPKVTLLTQDFALPSEALRFNDACRDKGLKTILFKINSKCVTREELINNYGLRS